LAVEKALAARAEGLARGATVLSFDTIVVHEGELLGKPADTADAWRMLRALSGRTHSVVTGCGVLIDSEEQPRSFSVVTDVQMKELSDCQIEAWMAQGTFLGCAGAYNIEAQVASVTEDVCHQNVAGLPLCHLYAALSALPSDSLPGSPASPITPCDAALGRSCRLGPRVVAATAPSAD
jgi:septum formation protein